MMNRTLQILSLFVFMCVECGNSPPPDSTSPPQTQKVFTEKITDRASFQNFSRTIAQERFTKFIVNIKSKEIYYFDVNVFPLHVDFVFKGFYHQENYSDFLEQFNLNYEVEKPEFLLCYLVYHKALNLWTFTFWEGDKMTAEHVLLARQKLRDSFYLGDQVLFRPDSNRHEKIAQELEGQIGVITNDKIYKSSDYQAFNTGKRIGRLRIVRSERDAKHFNPEDILILSVTLPDLTVVSGVISETFSTPLSHIALRARAWNIPHVGLKGAMERFAAFEGKMVSFSATEDNYELREATPEEISKWKKRLKERHTIKIPKSDLTQKKIKSLGGLMMEDVPAYGAKSANLGELYLQQGEYSVPSGFALPIHYYHQHITRHGIDQKIKALLSNAKALNNQPIREVELSKIRTAITQAPLDEKLLNQVMSHIKTLQLKEEGGVFVRSSTTAEDLSGFNGAGLYDTVPNVRGRAQLSSAIRKVWASVWNLRAFEERSFFGIDHASVYAGVLFQTAVNATAAGVLITKNLYNSEELDNFTINAKSGLGFRVVEGRRVPEQLLYDPRNHGIKVISRSDDATMLVFNAKGGIQEIKNPNAGRPVLTDEKVFKLGRATLSIINRYPSTETLDIEWLFVDDRLYIVQVRPFVGK